MNLMMKFKLSILTVLFLLSAQTVFGQEFGWLKKIEKIRLLTSTRNDVVEILGRPKDEKPAGVFENFLSKEGEFTVRYSTGKCSTTMIDGKELPVGYKVEKFTVIELDFEPKKRPSLEELEIELKKLDIDVNTFKTYPIHDFPKTKTHENLELGIMFYTDSKQRLISISFYPTDKYNYLHCK